MTPNVYTYFHPVPQIDQAPELHLIDLWRATWLHAGWNPVVLGPVQVWAHPLYREYDALTRNFPTKNYADYERACWLRWLALQQVGGGMMTDYDVMNRGFKPEHVSTFEVCLYGGDGVPCAVSTDGPQDIPGWIMRSEHKVGTGDGGRTLHYSDMVWFQTRNFHRDHHALDNVGDPFYLEAKLVHYSHYHCRQLLKHDATVNPTTLRVALIKKDFNL